MAEATWVTPQVALSEAITAAKLGQMALARRILNEIVAKEPKNERAWLWIAGLAEDRTTAYAALNGSSTSTPGTSKQSTHWPCRDFRRARRKPTEAAAESISGGQSAPPEVAAPAAVSEPSTPTGNTGPAPVHDGGGLSVEKVPDLQGDCGCWGFGGLRGQQRGERRAAARCRQKVRTEAEAGRHVDTASIWLFST